MRFCLFDGVNQQRNNLEQVANDAVICHFENRCIVCLVDSDDAFRILHSGFVLNRTGNSQCYVYLRMYGLSGLTNLMIRTDPAGIYHRTGCANDAAQQVCQFFCQLNSAVYILRDTTANGYDEVRANQPSRYLLLRSRYPMLPA